MITQKQLEVLKVIYEFKRLNNYSPTVREVGKELGLKSPSTTYEHIRKLIKKGYMTKVNNSGRSITLTERGKELLEYQ